MMYFDCNWEKVRDKSGINLGTFGFIGRATAGELVCSNLMEFLALQKSLKWCHEFLDFFTS